MLLQFTVDALNAAATSSAEPVTPPVENWTADRIEEALSVPADPMRRPALEAATAFRTELVPRLIGALDRALGGPSKTKFGADILWVHALFLLASWQEPAAANVARRLFSSEAQPLRGLPVDALKQFAPKLMASLLGDDPRWLVQMARDTTVDDGLRCDAISALGCLAAWNRIHRSALVDLLRPLASNGLAREASVQWTTLASLVQQAGLYELIPDLQPAFHERWVDPELLSWDEFERQIAAPPESLWPQFVSVHPPLGDVAEATAWLDDDPRVALGDLHERSLVEDAVADLDSGELSFFDPSSLPFRAPPSVGRNDPCPCGSGRKYKKCCGG